MKDRKSVENFDNEMFRVFGQGGIYRTVHFVIEYRYAPRTMTWPFSR